MDEILQWIIKDAPNLIGLVLLAWWMSRQNKQLIDLLIAILKHSDVIDDDQIALDDKEWE